jgi:hypothetical protein
MAIRDLGYRAYEGERLPASNNSKVLLRHGLRRAWGSWLVKIAAFTGWIPPIVACAIVGIMFWITQQAPPGAEVPEMPAAEAVRDLFSWQIWLFVTMVTIGAGAAAIAEDLQFRAFQFYFSKPVTPPQYLLGRIGAVAFWVFMMTFPGALLLVLVLVGTAPEELRLERTGLLLPTIFYSAIIAVVTACGSVGLSSLSKSRALTMSAWIILFLVPHALGAIVNAVSGWPYILLLSLPELLNIVGDALFKIEPETTLRWYHAAPVLALVAAGGTALALTRIRNAEVIT